MTVRPATPDDISAVKRIADGNKTALGFVMRPALVEAQARGELLVAEEGGAVVGFVNYRTLTRVRPGWRTVYEICVCRDARGKGHGAALLDAVPRPVRLKCPVDLPSNEFYRRYGLLNVWTEDRDSKRSLNVWQTQPDVIYCAGGNKRLAGIARDAGMLYGTRHDDTPAFKPHMVDINWKRYDWRDYLAKIERWQPVMAMVPDYETPEHRGRMVTMARQLVERGVERVMVCPKFPGAVAHIPAWCLVAVSVPTRYAGFLPEPSELRGRRVHLLGGSPQAQMRMAREYAGQGIVVSSVDGNAWQGHAQMGVLWIGGRWVTLPPTDRAELGEKAAVSAMNIMAAWRERQPAQLPLF